MTALRAEAIEIDSDPEALLALSLQEKWGDGAPLMPPTRERIEAMLQATPKDAGEILAVMPPRHGAATVELAAINAVMAGCSPRMFPLVVAAVEAMARPDYNAVALTTTTAPVAPYLIVNGPSRDELQIDYRAGCHGGAGGRGSATIGRAVQLCMRNIGGLRVGETSRSVFGQPARFGMCFGEWEERSDWPSLAMRRGFSAEQEVVTVYGGMGIIPIVDANTSIDKDMAFLIAKTIAQPMSNLFTSPIHRSGEVLVVLNPIWAERYAATWPRVEDLQAYIHEHAWQSVDFWPPEMRKLLHDRGRVDAKGRVHALKGPQQVEPIVCGGLGSLHGALFMTFGETLLQSVAVARPD